MNKESRIKYLFQKYLDRTATVDELEEMFMIFKDRQAFESVYHQFEQDWESSDVSFTLDQLTPELIRVELAQRTNVQSVGRKQTLRTRSYRWIAGIAAAIAVLGTVSIWYFTRCNELMYETGYGETREIVLDDNSTIQLNANSRLVWKTDWRKKEIRQVYLDGEAFFQVNELHCDEKGESDSSAEKLPFRVITPDLTVNVYGTSFNVVSRRAKTDVFLESGSVELELNVNQEEELNQAPDSQDQMAMKTILMKPGDAVSYSVYNQFLEHVNNSTTHEHASWVEGSLTYENERFENVLNSLEDIYGIDFQVNDTDLLNRKVNLGLPYQDWETVSGLMTLSLEIKMNEENGIITLERKKGN